LYFCASQASTFVFADPVTWIWPWPAGSAHSVRICTFVPVSQVNWAYLLFRRHLIPNFFRHKVLLQELLNVA
jgi:hypothetical protein